jgi:hypothetical protein
MFRDPEGKIILAWAIAQILLGTVVYAWLEGWSPIDALYFSVVTLATVGFGDLHPTTDAAKLFTILYILFGLGVIAAFISEITKHRAAVIAGLRPHHDASDQEAGGAGPGATSPQPPATDEDARI